MNLKYMIAASLVSAGLLFSQSTQSNSNSSQPESQQYEGPSILSRDRSLIGERGGKLLDFRVYASITGVYDSGLTPVSVTSTGKVPSYGDEGVEVGFGAIGSRQWSRDSVSLEYSGSYRHYVKDSFFDGTDQFLNLRYGHIISRRLTFDLKETAGISSLGNGAYSFLPLTNTDMIAVPANELFDNRTIYSQSKVSLIWQKTNRLSFSFGGDGYIVRRRSLALAGLTGYGAHADVGYRITRRQTIDLLYNYTRYDEQHVFGMANIQTLSLGYNLGIGRRYDFGISLGGSYLDYRGLQQVTLDPAIAAIVGVSSVVSNFHQQSPVPYGQIRLTRRFRRSSITADASTGVSPGNGVFYTSRATNAGLNYSFSGPRRWTAGVSFQYSSLSSYGQNIGKYENYQAGLGATYRFTRYLHGQFRYDYRKYTTQNSIFQKDSNRFSIGLAFSPGSKPLPIW